MDTFHSCKRFLFLSTPSARRATYYFNVPCRILWKFLSTPSARRATLSGCCRTVAAKQFLSTPSARRATLKDNSKTDILSNFYPRPPRGGRPESGYTLTEVSVFLSTPSARRATCPPRPYFRRTDISIHALREEGDRPRAGCSSSGRNFYPRPPRGGRRFTRCATTMSLSYFYPRPPRGGRR